MMNKLFIRNAGIVGALLIAWGLGADGSVASAAEPPSPARWVPQDTFVLVEIPNFKQFHNQRRKTSWYRMSQDEQVKQALGTLSKDFDEALENYAKKLGLDNAEQLKVEPEGGAALVVLYGPPRQPDGEPQRHIAIVADWGENSAKMQELLAKVTQTAIDRGGSKKTDTFMDIRITTIGLIEPPQEEGERQDIFSPMAMGPMGLMTDPQKYIVDQLKEMPLPENVTYSSVGSVTILGSDVHIVKEITRRVKEKTSDALAQNKDYQALRQYCAPLGQVNLFINIPQAIKVGLASADDEKKRIIGALGIESLRSFVATVSLASTSGANVEVRGFLPVQGEKRGLVKMFTEKVVNKSVMPEKGIPGSSVVCGWINFRFDTLIDQIYQILKQVDPEDAEKWKSDLKKPVPTMVEGQEPEIIDLEAIIGNLSMPLKGYMALTPPYERENLSLMLSINHRNREVVGKLFDVVGQFLLKRDLAGQTIYDVAFPLVGISLALTNDALVLGSTASVEQMFRTGGDSQATSLASDSRYKRNARLAPREAWMVLYADKIRSFEATLEMHKRAKSAAEAGEEAAPAFTVDVTDMLLTMMKEKLLLKLDHPEAMKKYRSSTIFTASNTSKGIQFYMNELNPAQE